MKKYVLILLALLLIPASSALSASSCTQEHFKHANLDVIEMSWTAHTDGTFASVATTWPINGSILVVDTDPGATAPTDNYDITLTDSYGIDVMGGALANRSTSASQRSDAVLNSAYGPAPVIGRVTLNISNNAVNGATGKVRIIYVTEDY